MDPVLDAVKQALAFFGNGDQAAQVNDPAGRREDADHQEFLRLGRRLALVFTLFVFNTFYDAGGSLDDDRNPRTGNETLASTLQRFAGHGLMLLFFQVIISMGLVLRRMLNLRVDKVQLAIAFMGLISFSSFVAWLVGV